MKTSRMEAFSDGVIAILITIMVLELHPPSSPELSALKEVAPSFLSYVLSFIYLGIYWNNHHHMLHVTEHVTGRILWANLHLLFWLSLIPFATRWMGENHLAAVPSAVYGFVLLMAGVAYLTLSRSIIAEQGHGSALKAAVGRDYKGQLSAALYAAAIPLAFLNHRISAAIYVGVAAMWLVPDPRIERQVRQSDQRGAS